MRTELKTPLIYLISSGQATNQTLATDCERILALVGAAIAAGVSLIQIREKNLSTLALFELTRRAAVLTLQSSTKLLVNDRADVARAAGADGVHLTTQSLEAGTIRSAFGQSFLIGVSTHSIEEVRQARNSGSDFAVFGPLFETPSKNAFGPPIGVDTLRAAAQAVKPFPIIAIGGITRHNAALAFSAGASGVAAIRALNNPQHLRETVHAIHDEAVIKLATEV